MRKCPKCGYEDPPYWRTCRWNGLVDYTHIDNLRIHEPQLAQQIEESGTKTIIIEEYAYHMIRNMPIVHRQWKQHYNLYKWHGEPREHINHIPPNKRHNHITNKHPSI